MTKIISANIGSYPRIGEEKDQQRHRRAIQYLQSGELSKHAVTDVQQSVTQEAVREQIEAGLDEVTDGQVTWNDPITKFCENIKGIKMTGLSRYFDANFYYRVPVFSATPKKNGLFMAEEFKQAQQISSRPVRAVLTGPFTLAAHSVGQIKPYDHFNSRLQFFAEILREEIQGLSGAGAKIIQIDEPSLPFMPKELPKAGKIFESLLNGVTARKILALYFGPLALIYGELLALPFDSLNLEISFDDKKFIEIIMAEKSEKILGLGLLNSRTTKLEPIDPILKVIRLVIERLQPPALYITPSTGLEYLPRQAAQAKLKLLNQIKMETTRFIGGSK